MAKFMLLLTALSVIVEAQQIPMVQPGQQPMPTGQQPASNMAARPIQASAQQFMSQQQQPPVMAPTVGMAGQPQDPSPLITPDPSALTPGMMINPGRTMTPPPQTINTPPQPPATPAAPTPKSSPIDYTSFIPAPFQKNSKPSADPNTSTDPSLSIKQAIPALPASFIPTENQSLNGTTVNKKKQPLNNTTTTNKNQTGFPKNPTFEQSPIININNSSIDIIESPLNPPTATKTMMLKSPAGPLNTTGSPIGGGLSTDNNNFLPNFNRLIEAERFNAGIQVNQVDELKTIELIDQLKSASRMKLSAHQLGNQTIFLNSLTPEQKLILESKLKTLSLTPTQVQLERNYLGTFVSQTDKMAHQAGFDAVKKLLTPEVQRSFDAAEGMKSLQLTDEQKYMYEEGSREFLEDPGMRGSSTGTNNTPNLGMVLFTLIVAGVLIVNL
ncbi:hypothetical protein KEM48_005373 [Puccinia striiformis f. sp. tritici PST-130]|nr:hypothetical protein Pst134EB_028457 [Puccinia striiformis f. sp. tritici]KAI9616116.1 hypothetical protein KEM48_005373 [Puccinia striiformis f. sp. tritici PST-130]